MIPNVFFKSNETNIQVNFGGEFSLIAHVK
jgi:hypothetical protein